MKTGPKPKSKCSKGHDTTICGRTKAGNCKLCQKEYFKKRWDFIRSSFPKEDNNGSPM